MGILCLHSVLHWTPTLLHKECCKWILPRFLLYQSGFYLLCQNLPQLRGHRHPGGPHLPPAWPTIRCCFCQRSSVHLTSLHCLGSNYQPCIWIPSQNQLPNSVGQSGDGSCILLHHFCEMSANTVHTVFSAQCLFRYVSLSLLTQLSASLVPCAQG